MKINHSQMLTKRRNKKRNKKQLAAVAKQAKKSGNEKVKAAAGKPA